MNITHNPDKEVIKTILGYTDDITTCDCCGKVDLKGTYAIDLNGDISYYGSVCAFKIHGVTFEEQKEVKQNYVRRIKAEQKLNEMELVGRTDAYWVTKMLKFVESKPKSLDLNAFILKYGKVFEDSKYYTAYQVGNIVKLIQK